MSSVATATHHELEALTLAEREPLHPNSMGAGRACGKGWLKPIERGHPDWVNSPVRITEARFELTPRGRDVLADARALGWKSSQLSF